MKNIKYLLGSSILLVILVIGAQLPVSAANFPAKGTFVDTDGDMGEMAGKVIFNWDKSYWFDDDSNQNPKNVPFKFDLYLNNGSSKPAKTFTGKLHNDYRFVHTIPQNTKLTKLGEVKATGKKRYSFEFPSTNQHYLRLVILPEIKGQYISSLDVDIKITNQHYNQRIRRYTVTDNISASKEKLTLSENMMFYTERNYFKLLLPIDTFFPYTFRFYDSENSTEPIREYTLNTRDIYLGTYQFHLPDEYKDVYVDFTNNLGNTSNRVHYQIEPKLFQYTPKLTSKDVVFNNKKGTKDDYILVKNVSRGDVIYAYYSEKDYRRVDVKKEHIRADGSIKISVGLDDAGGNFNINYEKEGYYFASGKATIPYGKAK